MEDDFSANDNEFINIIDPEPGLLIENDEIEI